MNTATGFQAKKEIYHTKQQRLSLAQHEYQNLNEALEAAGQNSFTDSKISCKKTLILSKRSLHCEERHYSDNFKQMWRYQTAFTSPLLVRFF